jgi:hypothetical protein
MVAVPQLKKLVAGFAPWLLEFEPQASHIGFVLDEAPMSKNCSRILASSASYSVDCSTVITACYPVLVI